MYKTAEYVSPMHPDKICDRISDAIVDECLKYDPDSRVAVEVMGGHGHITITGEVMTKADLSKDILREITESIAGPKSTLHVHLTEQSPEISRGIDVGGAGDQGIVTGYATNETADMIPRELFLARELCKSLYDQWPVDGKVQITIGDEGELRVIVASWLGVSREELQHAIAKWANTPGLDPNTPRPEGIALLVNPSGDWQVGGFDADTGLTGRKVVMDNYGPQIPVGGGAFSGKDPSKVDRSAAYMARHIAVDLLKKNQALEVFVKLAYAIGCPTPVMANASMKFMDGPDPYWIHKDLMEEKLYDLTPNGIKAWLQLTDHEAVCYHDVAQWGHFGLDVGTWNNPSQNGKIQQTSPASGEAA